MHKLAIFLEEKLQFYNELLIINFITTTTMIHRVQPNIATCINEEDTVLSTDVVDNK